MRDLIAWGAALLVLLGTVLGLGMNIILGFVLALLVFLGMFFVLNPKSSAQELAARIQQLRRGAPVSMVGAKVEVSRLRHLTVMIDQMALREGILTICDMTSDLLVKLEKQALVSNYTISRINYIFTLMSKSVSGYINLSGQAPDSTRIDRLVQQLNADVVPKVKQALEDYSVEKDNPAVFEAAVSALETVVKSEGFV